MLEDADSRVRGHCLHTAYAHEENIGPRGFILSRVWLETLVFDSIWEVPYF